MTNDLLSKIREANNVYNLDRDRNNHPTAFQLVKNLRAFQDSPRCPRSPERVIANVDSDVSDEVSTFADWFDISKSQAVEMMLRIAAGELHAAWKEFDETGGIEEHTKTDIDGFALMSSDEFKLEATK